MKITTDHIHLHPSVLKSFFVETMRHAYVPDDDAWHPDASSGRIATGHWGPRMMVDWTGV
jgi:hypothetical protein